MQSVSWWCSFINHSFIINPFNQSTAVHEKISFGVGNKALVDRQAFLQFSVLRLQVRLTNVLGCVR